MYCITIGINFDNYLEKEANDILEHQSPNDECDITCDILLCDKGENKQHKCLWCNESNNVKNGPFTRYLLFINNDNLVISKITLQRYLCKECGRSFTYYPKYVLPYEPYSTVLFMLIILYDGIISVFADDYSLTQSTVRRLRRIYKKIKLSINSKLRKDEKISPQNFRSEIFKNLVKSHQRAQPDTTGS